MNSCDKTVSYTEVSVTRPVNGCDPEDLLKRAYAVMIDVASYPEYMPSVDALDILSQNKNQMITRWDADIDGAPVRWVQTIVCLEDDRKMRFEATEGDFDVFRGEWKVSTSGDQLYLNLHIEYRIGIPVIETVLGPILKEKVDSNARELLSAIADRLEVQA